MTNSRNGTSDRTLRVAIVGCGNIAHQHARAYAASGRTEVGRVGRHRARARRGVRRRLRWPTYPDVTSLMSGGSPGAGQHRHPARRARRIGREGAAGGYVSADREASVPDPGRVRRHRRGGAGRRRHRRSVPAPARVRCSQGRGLLGSGALGRPQVAVCETLWYRPDSYFDPAWRGTWSGEGGGPTLGHGIHQIDLLLHLLAVASPDGRRGPAGATGGVRGRVAGHGRVRERRRRLGGQQPAVTTRAQPDRIDHRWHAGGQPRVRVSDADWSFVPPRMLRRRRARQGPGLRDTTGALRDSTPRASDGANDVWAASAGIDVPSNHAAQITRLVDDLLAGRTHQTTLASTRSTVEFVSGCMPRRCSAKGSCGTSWCLATFYADLSGGMAADDITARMTDSTRIGPDQLRVNAAALRLI